MNADIALPSPSRLSRMTVHDTLAQIQQLHAEIEAFQIRGPEDAEQFKQRFTVRKGKIALLFGALQQLEGPEKRSVGAQINALKAAAQRKLSQTRAESARSSDVDALSGPMQDVTLPPPHVGLGSIHPLSLMQERIIALFSRIGFEVSEGPEIEDDWHNFTALNFGPDHPSRDMQDTFFLGPDAMLRTHTSSVQVRVMQSQSPPIRTLSPGRVYRNEAVSARTHCMFHQIEGLYIDDQVSFADLKATLAFFVEGLFGKKTRWRLRPSYFPFTEPSTELDIHCLLCTGEGCSVCKHTGWVEVLGAGMVDPQVLVNCEIDPTTYAGFAFGIGVERITMLLYGIQDLRQFTENDVRFLEQFTGA